MGAQRTRNIRSQDRQADRGTEQDRAAVAALSALFREHVDVKQLLADLEGATARPSEWAADLAQYPTGAGG